MKMIFPDGRYSIPAADNVNEKVTDLCENAFKRVSKYLLPEGF